MAIYQFYLGVIPKKGILSFFEHIPHKLNTNFEETNNEFLNSNLEDNTTDEFELFLEEFS